MLAASSIQSVGINENNAKKKTFTYSEKSEEKRIEFLEKLEEVPQNMRVYLDESGCDEFHQRERGRALRGVKVEDVCRGRKYERTNVIAAKCGGEIWASKTYKHTTNGRFFLDWFEFDLLSIVPCGHTVIMDNASFHPKKELSKIAYRYGIYLLFLPPYSPDFNPIEKFWANLKKWLRDYLCLYISLPIAISEYCIRLIS